MPESDGSRMTGMKGGDPAPGRVCAWCGTPLVVKTFAADCPRCWEHYYKQPTGRWEGRGGWPLARELKLDN